VKMGMKKSDQFNTPPELDTLREGTIEQQVAYWMVQIADGGLTTEQQADLNEWCAEDEAHEVAFMQAHRAWGLMEKSDELAAGLSRTVSWQDENDDASKEHVVGRSFMRWPFMPFAVAATVFLAVLTAINSQYFYDDSPLAALHSTKISEVRNLSLADGSQVVLGAGSTVAVDIGDDERSVTLLRGQAFFNVTKDPSRPFIVEVGGQRVVVIGTQFDVRRGEEKVTVGVKEGIVDVAPVLSIGSQPMRETRLVAGQKMDAIGNEQVLVTRAVIEEVAAWRSGRLHYANETLREIVADANRHFDGTIVFIPRSLGDKRITASFRTDQIDDMIRSLASAFALEVDRSKPGRILLRPLTSALDSAIETNSIHRSPSDTDSHL